MCHYRLDYLCQILYKIIKLISFYEELILYSSYVLVSKHDDVSWYTLMIKWIFVIKTIRKILKPFSTRHSIENHVCKWDIKYFNNSKVILESNKGISHYFSYSNILISSSINVSAAIKLLSWLLNCALL